MKKALVFSTISSGHAQYATHRNVILKELRTVFDVVDEFVSQTFEDGQEELKEHAADYDYLILVGGDGTVHSAINAIMTLEKKPIIGYINNGTLGDVGRSIGIPSSYRKALKAIRKLHVEKLDLVKANGRYFTYMAAIGAYSDVSYTTKRKRKRFFHRFAYYFSSAKEAFHRYQVEYKIKTENGEYEGTSPFLLILNGTHVGGFEVNKNGSNHDGLLELFITPQGMFNGLPHYFVSKKKVLRIPFKDARIEIKNPSAWCFDGEEGESGDLDISVVPSAIEVITNPKGKKS